MPDTIILVGGYGIPDRTASATRALGIAKLFQSLGLEVILMGKIGLDTPPRDRSVEQVIDCVRCLDVRRPFPGRNYLYFERSADSAAAVIDSLPSAHRPAAACSASPRSDQRPLTERRSA